MEMGDGLDRVLKRDGVVGSGQHLGITEVDLMLAHGHFVLSPLDLDAQLIQGEHDVLTNLGGLVPGREIEVAGHIVGDRLNPGLAIHAK